MSLFEFNLALPITDPTWVFSLVLIIILFAPTILGRLHIPHIIGIILAGVLIGERGFHVLDRDNGFELFGKVGPCYIIFLAGLEMDMEDFKKNRVKGVVFDLLTFLVPMALGIWSSMSMLGYGFLIVMLLVSMHTSHALIAYPIISHYGLSRLCSVNITIGGTAVTVTPALIILAVIDGIFRGIVDGPFWALLVAKAVLLGFLIIFSFPRIGRWFFRKYDDGVMQSVFALTMVFLGGGLMELIGMGGILGAFLAGLVLNRLIPYVSPLMNHLGFAGNALFIPYSLIGVGMIIDVKSLSMRGEALKVAIVMTVVVTFSKWLAAWVTQRIYRVQPDKHSMIFGLSDAQATATLATMPVGREIIMKGEGRLLDDGVLNGTAVMIPLTCVASSLVTERSARRFALDGGAQPGNKEAKKAMEQIPIPVANPETTESLTNLVLVIENTKQKNDMIALNVINNNNSPENKELRGKQNLEKATMVTATADVPMTMVSCYSLDITLGIIHTIKECEATGVTIGLHRKANIVDSFFDSLVESLLKGTHHEAMTTKFLMLVNTLHHITIAVPPRIEFRTDSSEQMEHFYRMRGVLGCRMCFFASERTLIRLQQLMKKKFNGTSTKFSLLEKWGDPLLLIGQANYDHLSAVISTRRSSISYDPSSERLLARLSKYFSNNSLIILYPDQFGDPQEIMPSSDPRGHDESQYYEKVSK